MKKKMSQKIDLKNVLAMIQSNDNRRMDRLTSLYGINIPYEECTQIANARASDALVAIQVILKYLIAREEKQ